MEVGRVGDLRIPGWQRRAPPTGRRSAVSVAEQKNLSKKERLKATTPPVGRRSAVQMARPRKTLDRDRPSHGSAGLSARSSRRLRRSVCRAQHLTLQRRFRIEAGRGTQPFVASCRRLNRRPAGPLVGTSCKLMPRSLSGWRVARGYQHKRSMAEQNSDG